MDSAAREECAASETDRTMNDDEVIAAAIRILEKRIREGDCLASPQAVREYLRLAIGEREREVFVVVMLDAQHRVIAVEELFAGTLTQTSVYPREVVKCVLRHNAGAVIFAHNHPSGVAEPSQADQILTQTLQRALGLVDVKVLDHFVVARGAALCFRGARAALGTWFLRRIRTGRSLARALGPWAAQVGRADLPSSVAELLGDLQAGGRVQRAIGGCPTPHGR